MFGLVEQIFVSATMFSGSNISSVNSLNVFSLNSITLNAIPLKCVSINNEECELRPEIINISNNEPLFHPYNIKVN